MTCRKTILLRARDTTELWYRSVRCRGTIDDSGRCTRCGGAYGKRAKKPVTHGLERAR